MLTSSRTALPCVGSYKRGPVRHSRDCASARRDDISAVKQVHTGPLHPHGHEPDDVSRLGALTAPQFPGLHARGDGCRVDMRQRRHSDLHRRSRSRGRAATSPPLAVPRVRVRASVRWLVRALAGACAVQARACCGGRSPTGRSAASRKSRAPAPAPQAPAPAPHHRHRRLCRRTTGVAHPTSRHAGVGSPVPPSEPQRAWMLGF